MFMKNFKAAPAYFAVALLVGLLSTILVPSPTECAQCPQDCGSPDYICFESVCCQNVGIPTCPAGYPLKRHVVSRETGTGCVTKCSRQSSCVSECIPS